jgi:hypothetical protein
MAFGIACQQSTCFVESGFVMEAGEDIEDLALGFRGVAGSVGRDKGELEASRCFHDGLIARFFVAIEVALEFDVDIAASEGSAQSFECFVGVSEVAGQGAFIASGEADQAFGKFGEFFGKCGLFVASSQLHAGDEAAEIPVAFAGFGQEGVAAAIMGGHFRTYVRLDALFFGSAVETWGSEDSIDVCDGDGGGCAGGYVVFRDAGSLEEAEGGFCVEFYVHWKTL